MLQCVYVADVSQREVAGAESDVSFPVVERLETQREGPYTRLPPAPQSGQTLRAAGRCCRLRYRDLAGAIRCAPAWRRRSGAARWNSARAPGRLRSSCNDKPAPGVEQRILGRHPPGACCRLRYPDQAGPCAPRGVLSAMHVGVFQHKPRAVTIPGLRGEHPGGPVCSAPTLNRDAPSSM